MHTISLAFFDQWLNRCGKIGGIKPSQASGSYLTGNGERWRVGYGKTINMDQHRNLGNAMVAPQQLNCSSVIASRSIARNV
ncbi:MAG TPA: hypothetical protein VGG19_05665 [Tepidisphaeraceae bacterium]